MSAIKLCTLLAICSFLSFGELGYSQSNSNASTNKEEQAASKTPVADALLKLKKVCGKFNRQADYYIYLFSASWCGPCRAEMPKIVEAYKKMRRKGVEVVLMSADKTPEDAENYVEQYKAKFYTVMGKEARKAKIPGIDKRNSGGVPHCVIVDRYGQFITSNHPAVIIPEWESYTIDKGTPQSPEDKSKDQAADASADAKPEQQESPLLKVQRLKTKFGRVPESSDYLLIGEFSANDSESEAVLDALAGELPKLKEKHVAVLLVCHDKSTQEAEKMLRTAKLKAPVVFSAIQPKKTKSVSNFLPAISTPITLVDKSGKIILADDAGFAAKWQNELTYQQKLQEWEHTQVDKNQYPVAAALKNATTPTSGMFDTKADYFIYFFSASTCGFCHQAIPYVVDIHEEMKGKGVDVILVSEDDTIKDAEKYLQKHDAKFFAIIGKDARAAKIPGVNNRREWGIPECMVIDKYGRIIRELDPRSKDFPKWQEYTINRGIPSSPQNVVKTEPDEAGSPSQGVSVEQKRRDEFKEWLDSREELKSEKLDADQFPVAEALKKAADTAYGKFNTKANYYIYLYTVGGQVDMPKYVSQLETIQQKGVNVILVNLYKTREKAERDILSSKLKFFTILETDAALAQIPGYVTYNKLQQRFWPSCLVTDRFGREITQISPEQLLKQWESLTLDKGVPQPPAESEK